MKKVLIAIAITLTLVLSGCSVTGVEKATRVLVEDGYSDIQFTGYDLFGCSEDDLFKNKFTAKNSNGKVVHGVVCSGVLKGATIRRY